MPLAWQAGSSVRRLAMTELAKDRFGAPLTRDAVIAVAALLMGAANSDNLLHKVERDSIAAILVRYFAVNDAAAHDVATIAAEFLGTPERLVDCARLVRDFFSSTQHELILSLLLQVCVADNNYDPSEKGFILSVAAQLGFTPAEVRGLAPTSS